jgi:hypothetical protein
MAHVQPPPPTLQSLQAQVAARRPRIYLYPRLPEWRLLERRIPLRPHGRYLRDLTRFFQRFQTDDHAEADLFFPPVNLLFYQFVNVHRHRFSIQSPTPEAFRDSLVYLDRGRHALLATGDFGQRSRSRYESHAPGRAYPELYHWLDQRFSLLAFESTRDLLPQDVALLPYVQSEEGILALMRSLMRPPAARGTRDLLFSFAGMLAYPQLPSDHIRGGRLRAIAAVTDDSFVGTADQARDRYGARRGSDVAMIARSTFTLCPAGFGRWTFRFGQALSFGSIPVLLADGYELPHRDFIDWNSFVIRVEESRVLEVPDLLRSISADEITARRASLASHAHLFGREAVRFMGLLELLEGSEACDANRAHVALSS